MEALDEEDQGGYSELSTDWWQLLCKDVIIPVLLLAPHAKKHFNLVFLKRI